MTSLTHLNNKGEAHMVDVGAKPVQSRRAKAEAILHCSGDTTKALKAGGIQKGDALAVARIAGIQAAKRTSEWIPLCHPLPLTHINVEIEIGTGAVIIHCEAATDARTGVEMEALSGVSAAALSLYDMLKAIDKEMRIDGIRLLEKVKEDM